MAKLLFAFLLGVVLAVARRIATLQRSDGGRSGCSCRRSGGAPTCAAIRRWPWLENALGRDNRGRPWPLVRRPESRAGAAPQGDRGLRTLDEKSASGARRRPRRGASTGRETGPRARARPRRRAADAHPSRHDEHDARTRLQAAPGTQAALSTEALPSWSDSGASTSRPSPPVRHGARRNFTHRAWRVEKHIETRAAEAQLGAARDRRSCRSASPARRRPIHVNGCAGTRVVPKRSGCAAASCRGERAIDARQSGGTP